MDALGLIGTILGAGNTAWAVYIYFKSQASAAWSVRVSKREDATGQIQEVEVSNSGNATAYNVVVAFGASRSTIQADYWTHEHGHKLHVYEKESFRLWTESYGPANVVRTNWHRKQRSKERVEVFDSRTGKLLKATRRERLGSRIAGRNFELQ